MANTIFTKIINGEIPAHKVYEDENTLAFLDIHPKTSGHTLVIPKKPEEFVWDLDDHLYAALMSTVKKVAVRLKNVLEAEYVGMQVMGTDVPHAHVHVFPFNTSEEYHHKPDMTLEPNNDELADLARKLAF